MNHSVPGQNAHVLAADAKQPLAVAVAVVHPLKGGGPQMCLSPAKQAPAGTAQGSKSGPVKLGSNISGHAEATCLAGTSPALAVASQRQLHRLASLN